jgi:hypothetical protein
MLKKPRISKPVIYKNITNSAKLWICREIVEKALFDYSVFEQILIFFNIRLFV